jgi:serine O-acetyltransferase
MSSARTIEPVEGPVEHRPVPGLREAIRGDLEQMARTKECRFPSVGGYIDILSIPGTWAVILFRLASTAHHKGIRPLSRFIFFMNVVLFGAEMHPGAIIGPGLVVPHPVSVCFGSGSRAGRRLLLLRGSGMGGAGNPKRPGMPVLGDDVSLMDQAKVLGPVHVGDRTILGANAIVADDIAPDMFVYGARASDVVRPLAEMGLGAVAEAELGYGRAGRQAESGSSASARTPASATPASATVPEPGAPVSNGHRPTPVA